MILELGSRGIIGGKSLRREQATGSRAQGKNWILMGVKTCHLLKQTGRWSVHTQAGRTMRAFPSIASISSIVRVRQGHKLDI